jgi:hypothetical protein
VRLWDWLVERILFWREPEHIGWTEDYTISEAVAEAGEDFRDEAKRAESEEAARVAAEPTPLAEEVFDKLAGRGQLTGIGATVSAEWEPWDLSDPALRDAMDRLERDSDDLSGYRR